MWSTFHNDSLLPWFWELLEELIKLLCKCKQLLLTLLQVSKGNPIFHFRITNICITNAFIRINHLFKEIKNQLLQDFIFQYRTSPLEFQDQFHKVFPDYSSSASNDLTTIFIIAPEVTLEFIDQFPQVMDLSLELFKKVFLRV